MRRFAAALALATVLASPVQATEWGMAESRTGSFAGARLRLPLGGDASARPEASLAVAPMMERRSSNGRHSLAIGQGVALNLAGGRPELRLGALRADQAVRLAVGGNQAPNHKARLSTGAWLGIGAGVVAIGAVIFVTTLTCVGRDPDYCGSD